MADWEKPEIDTLGLILPDLSGLNTFTTVILQIHIADLPHTPGLCHPDILPTVTEARHHLINLTWKDNTYLSDLFQDLQYLLDFLQRTLHLL